MKTLLALLVLLASFDCVLHAQNCAESAKVVKPTLNESTAKIYQSNLAQAQEDQKRLPNADNLIWVGRRTAYLGLYKEAIEILSDGIMKFPKDARMYRHRGHRYITLRCFDDAIKDFEKAAKLIKGKPDEVEPDGLPNPKNIPTSTLQSNIWYHLGLAYYLKKDFKKALKAYLEAQKVSKNGDMRVATTHWHYMTLRRLGRGKFAARLLETVAGITEVIENDDYMKLIRLYRGELKAAELMREIGGAANTLGNASLGYGLGNWYLYNRDRDRATGVFRQIVNGNQWASFGFIAAEAELRGYD